MNVSPLGPGAELRIHAEPGLFVDAVPPAQVRALLDAHGALFFDGFQARVSQFHTLARTVVRKPRRTPLERVSHPLHPDVQTVTKGPLAQDFHAEFSHLPQRTEVMAFWCQVPGNPTYVVDGVRLFASLSSETQALLRDNRLRFSALHPPEMWHAVLGTDVRKDVEALVARVEDYSCQWFPDDNLVTHLVRPAVHSNAATGLPCLCNNLLPGSYAALWVTLEDGTPVPPTVLQEISAVARRESARIDWKPGDVLVLDNLRHMHARDAQPAHRRMFLLQGWR